MINSGYSEIGLVCLVNIIGKMQEVQKKLISLTISTSLLVLILPPFVSSSQDQQERTDHRHITNKHSIHKLTHKLSFEITLHGVLLWASMGFLMPLGILAIRMSNREECGRRLKIILCIHFALQTLAVLLATAAAIMSVKNFENSFSNSHQRMGLALYVAIWVQALIGFLRPHRGSRGRSIWFFVHWVLGTAVSMLGIINVFTGLLAYHRRTSRSIRLWSILFTAEISFLAFLYLFQEKLDYTTKQGVILGSEPIRPTDQGSSSPRPKPKEPFDDSC